MIEDETGKSLKAKTVFTHGIRYLKSHALATIDRQGKTLDEMDIHWVITVPAIWSDAAKQFMREAALAVRLFCIKCNCCKPYVNSNKCEQQRSDLACGAT